MVLAAATACGLARAPQARAGHWEQVNPVFSGHLTLLGNEDWWDWEDIDRAWQSSWDAMASHQAINYTGDSALVHTEGTLNAQFRWVRDYPDDKPPKALFLRKTVHARAVACSDTTQSLNPRASGEVVVATVDGVTDSVEDEFVTNYWSGDPISKRKVSYVYKSVVVPIATGGADLVQAPSTSISVKAQIPGGRTVDHESGGQHYLSGFSGEAQIYCNWSLQVLDLRLSPDPDGLALPDCSSSNTSSSSSSSGYSKPLNQYVIDSGVPCSAWVSGEDLRGSDWTLAREPMPLLPRVPESGGNDLDTNSFTIYPLQYHVRDDPDHPVRDTFRGLKFNTFDHRLPADNSQFGPSVLTHHVLGEEIPAPIALFYSATGTNHPAGGPPGYSHILGPDEAVPTPNWIYYYSKAWTPPCTVWYSPGNPGNYGYYTHGPTSGDSFVRLCAAHGEKWTLIFRRNSNGDLRVVGREKVKGIDTFARVATHENTHKRCWEAILNGMADTDGDEVPDAWEVAVGMKVQTGEDSTGFVDAWPGTYQSWEADREAFARLHEEGVFGPTGSDWADDGFNWGTAPPNACHPTLKEDNEHNAVDSFPGSPVSPLP